MVDVFSLRFLLAALIGWLDRQRQEALAYLIEEIESCGINCVGDAFD